MKNPDWNREELIIALDLYFQLDHGQMHSSNPKIKETSDILRSLDLHTVIPQPEKFRNINGVSLMGLPENAVFVGS